MLARVIDKCSLQGCAHPLHWSEREREKREREREGEREKRERGREGERKRVMGALAPFS